MIFVGQRWHAPLAAVGAAVLAAAKPRAEPCPAPLVEPPRPAARASADRALPCVSGGERESSDDILVILSSSTADLKDTLRVFHSSLADFSMISQVVVFLKLLLKT